MRVEAPARWSEAILVSGLTGLAYTCVYAYGLGYCSPFGIPIALISISVPSLIAVATIGLLASVYLWIFADMIAAPRVEKLGAVELQIIGIRLLVVAATMIAWLLPTDPLSKITLAVLTPVIFVVSSGLFRRLLYRLVPSLYHRLRRAPLPPEPAILKAFYNRYGSVAVLATIVAIFAPLFAFSAGLAVADFRKDFPVTIEKKPKVILAIFGDELIAADFDAKTRVVHPRFTIYDIGRNAPPFTILVVGRLKCPECTEMKLARFRGEFLVRHQAA